MNRQVQRFNLIPVQFKCDNPQTISEMEHFEIRDNLIDNFWNHLLFEGNLFLSGKPYF